MRRFIRFTILILLLAFIVIQFFRPEKNSDGVSSNHIFSQEKVPENIQILLSGACMDCHSSNTNYLWYHQISPVSWMVDDHVQHGKSELNFSEWGTMDIFEKITILEEICQETERKSMPLKSYKLMHPESKLSEEQIAELCDWTTKLAESMLKKAAGK
ncbi:heme-binding domain-containing protein [Draconibacterium sp. IB214405]|uniref:heme-binding domain-containing protein n=1 Tax=Draconibacterium sp. IB214405 TaxID=3097352 RepID=UPI002A13AC89|nr:heme-binding domain-containing protein [Draconibacterium sp. IB214405]MDX8340091.1 heme-binding domain-containing protein [Draconibacterium sp. IB214405]